MKGKRSGRFSLGLAALLSASLLAGCTTAGSIPARQHISPLVGPPVTDNNTPYSRCLAGLASVPGDNLPVIAVGDIRDKTGQRVATNYSGSTVLSQGVSEMLISALYKTRKVSIAERLDIGVTALEQKIGQMGMLARGPVDVKAPATNFVILGALTELNYNIVSDGARLFVAGIGGGSKRVVINVGLDLRVVESRTLRTVYVTSLQKQIVGYEFEAGIYRFFGNQLVEFDAGRLKNEPLQVGVRSVVEMAAFQIMTEGFKLPAPEDCALVTVNPETGSIKQGEKGNEQAQQTAARPDARRRDGNDGCNGNAGPCIRYARLGLDAEPHH